MIRRRKVSALLAYKQSAPIGIGELRLTRQDRRAAEEAAHIQRVRRYIWTTRPACQVCGGRRTAACAGLPDQMHEDPPRSKTRGRPLAERFNLLVCGRVCAACHQDLTEHHLRLVFANPDLGFLGPVFAVEV